jgi:hypothetical protein
VFDGLSASGCGTGKYTPEGNVAVVVDDDDDDDDDDINVESNLHFIFRFV